MKDFDNYSDLKKRLLADPEALVVAVILGMSAAGAEETWDAGTIEAVLEPIQDHLRKLSLPFVGTVDGDETAYWQSIVRAADILQYNGKDLVDDLDLDILRSVTEGSGLPEFVCRALLNDGWMYITSEWSVNGEQKGNEKKWERITLDEYREREKRRAALYEEFSDD